MPANSFTLYIVCPSDIETITLNQTSVDSFQNDFVTFHVHKPTTPWEVLFGRIYISI